MSITIEEMLNKSFFENATLISGYNSLQRKINWTHIIEIENCGHLLNGNEVIFTTGLLWKDDPNKGYSFIKQLIEHDVAALCVELVVHTTELPLCMINYALKKDFPIITFDQEVRFIDIMMNLHEKILGKKQNIWIQLDNFYHELVNTFINNQGIGEFLKILHKKTNKNIALEYKGEYRFFPALSKTKRKKVIDKIHYSNYYTYPLYLMNKKVGAIYFLHEFKDVSDFEELALKRFSDIINKFFLKNERQKEQFAIEQNTWLLNIINESLSNEEIINIFKAKTKYVSFKKAIIGLKPIQSTIIEKDKSSLNETKFIMNFRSVIEHEGLELIVTNDPMKKTVIFLVISKKDIDIESAIHTALYKIKSFKDSNFINSQTNLLNFGIPFNDVINLKRSFESAKITSHYRQTIGNLDKPFYNFLHFYRIYYNFHDKEELRQIIKYYIFPLMEHDTNKGTELVKTLTIYLEELGQKNETAKKLHIVRQTLYHRLNKIEELIGKDFLDKDKRFMIEFALKASKYLA